MKRASVLCKMLECERFFREKRWKQKEVEKEGEVK